MATIDSDAYVREWLLCGPFPGRDLTPEERELIEATGYSQAPFLRGGQLTDYLCSAGGEANACPREGDVAEAPDQAPGGAPLVWTRYVSPADVVDFEEIFDSPYAEPWPYALSVLYGYAALQSAAGGPGYIEVGSDDSARVYLNGQLVHDAHVRHCTLHRDFVPVRWEQGDNALLVKVENCGGPGGFIIRAVDASSDGFVPITFEAPVKTIWVRLADGAESGGFSARHTEGKRVHVPMRRRWEE